MKTLKNTLLFLLAASIFAACTTVQKPATNKTDKVVKATKVEQPKYPLADTIYKYSVKEVYAGYELSENMKRIANEIKTNLPSDVTVRQLGQGVVVSMAKNKGMFPFGEFTLNEEVKPYLQSLAFNLKKNPNTYVAAFGITDPIGTEDYNQKLGYRRAAAVANYLNTCGVEKERIFVDSFGEKYPEMVGEKKPTMYEKRRVDILIIPSNSMRKYTGM